jgi:N-acetylglucosaminyl-diphospho-decaprenol L-rhamnosyltransferase
MRPGAVSASLGRELAGLDDKTDRSGSDTRIDRTVDVVVPTFDARELALACVARLVEEQAVARVIVVDDASSDGTAEAVADRFPDFHVMRLCSHRGLAHACNVGAAGGSAELLLFLNNDILTLPGAISRLAAALRDDDEAVSAGGRLVDPGTMNTQLAYQPRQIPGLRGLLVRISGIERSWPRNPWTGKHLTAPLSDSVRQRTERQLAGACLMVRRVTFADVGGWDDRYWMWYEDVDLSRRLRARGPALYVPDAVFKHVGAASTRSWRKHEQHLRLYHGTLVYARQHLSPTRQRALAAAMVLACAPRLLFHLLLRDAEATASYRSVLRAARALWRREPLPRPDVAAARPPVPR